MSLELAASFDAVDAGRWEHAVAEVLRRSGALPADAPDGAAVPRLSTTSYDGIVIRPLYTAADSPGVPASAVDRAGGWEVRQRHAGPDVAASRRAVLDDLENGVTSLWLVLGEAGIPVAGLSEVLADVRLDAVPVVLEAGPDTPAAAEVFLTLAGARGVRPELIAGNLGADPIGLRARRGTGVDLPAGLQATGRLARRVAGSFPALRAVTVDTTPYHDAGGSDVDELAASLATGLAYGRALTDAGLDAAAAFDQLEFRYSASADQFLTIAKFRAARRVWARVAEVCGVAARQRQHAVTSTAMVSRRDPWVNLLRATLACFGAGVGGADAVTVQPFDAAIGQPDVLARRIARNTSSLLVLESNVARVSDPAGGSWYVERLTADLAGAAWDRFTEIERAGGMAAALDGGLVARWVDEVWHRRRDDLAHRRAPLTGVSEFPDPAETPVLREPAPPPPGGGLPVRRYAAEYELLREAADAAPVRPAVFLATIGPLAGYTARASFAANLFGAGGFATPAAGPGTDPAAIAAAFTASGARLACLASSDRLYAEHAAAVAAALKAAGARKIWLAGRPGDRDDDGGVDGYVGAGVDALAVLREAHRLAGTGPDR